MKTGQVSIEPQFPDFRDRRGTRHPLGFLFGIFLWFILLIVFLVTLYVQWFSQSLHFLLQLLKLKVSHIPFWFLLLVVIFFFPVSLIIILSATFIQLVRA